MGPSAREADEMSTAPEVVILDDDDDDEDKTKTLSLQYSSKISCTVTWALSRQSSIQRRKGTRMLGRRSTRSTR